MNINARNYFIEFVNNLLNIFSQSHQQSTNYFPDSTKQLTLYSMCNILKHDDHSIPLGVSAALQYLVLLTVTFLFDVICNSMNMSAENITSFHFDFMFQGTFNVCSIFEFCNIIFPKVYFQLKFDCSVFAVSLLKDDRLSLHKYKFCKNFQSY